MTSHQWGPPAPLVGALRFLALFFTALATQAAFAQASDQPQQRKTFKLDTDVSIGTYGQLTYTRTPTASQTIVNGTSTTEQTQGTSDSAGVLRTVHQQFRPWLGYDVNFGYSKFTEEFSHGQQFVPTPSSAFPASSSFTRGSIRTNMYDLTIGYVVQQRSNQRISTFEQFGGGGLFFLPTQNNSSAKNQTRPAMLFGIGMNCKLTDHLDFRAEYRGFFYKSPDFTLPPYDGSNFPMTRLFTVTNAPAASLVYRFGGTKRPETVAKPQ